MERKIVICPRCGDAVSRFEIGRRGKNGREYIYAVHYSNETGRRRCYLGPRSEYKYVEKLLALDLRGLTVIDYITIAVNAIAALTRTIWTNEELMRIEAGVYELERELNQLKEKIKKWKDSGITEGGLEEKGLNRS